MTGRKIAVLAVFAAVVFQATQAQTVRERGYAVACLPSGGDLSGADQMLRAYHDIAHTPQEGGRCYFRFPKQDVQCMHPRQAYGRGLASNPGYPSHSGQACYFPSTARYREFIDALKARPPVSKSYYGGNVRRTWREVADELEAGGAELDR